MRVAICDDEKNIRELLEDKVKKLYPNARIICFSSGEELLLFEEHIDILLLDIQMPEINGMETAVELRKKDKNMILIFVTAAEEYVFQAFDVGAFHYLVKPINDEKLAQILNKAVKELGSKRVEICKNEDKYLMINSGGVHIKVMLEDIVYAEVFNRKIVIHKMDENIEYYGKMSDLEALTGDDFFRRHRAYLVNLKYVEKYDASTIYLEKGNVIMAKQNYPEFVKKYMKFMQRRG